MHSPMDLASSALVDPADSAAHAVKAVSIPLLVTCFAMTLTDGFDTLSISFAAPAIAADWHLPSTWLGALFSAGLLGGFVGALIAPVLFAKAGYRNALILCALWFSVGSLSVYAVTSVLGLGVLRFFTGIGLGAAIPLLTSVATEYFPVHFRSRAVSTMLIGMPLGGLTVGLLSALLIPQHGWRFIFLIGGVAPLLVVPLLWLSMPRGRSRTRPQSDGFMTWRDLLKSEKPSRVAAVAAACLLGMMIAYSIANWAPTLLRTVGLSTQDAFLSASLLHVISAVVMLGYGWFIDRFGLHKVAAIGYLAGAPFLAILGFGAHLGAAAIPLLVFGGILILGTPVALPVLAAYSFPAHLRVEAVSCYAVMARVGAAIGPFLSGWVIEYAHGIAGFTTMLALASVVTGIVVLILRGQEGEIRRN